MKQTLSETKNGGRGMAIPASENIISFKSINGPYGWLSNMSRHPVEWGGVEWQTTEHLFQALRFPEAPLIREEIRAQYGGMRAKMFSKKNQVLRSVAPRSEEDLRNMKSVLALKASKHDEVMMDLRATGDKILIEDVSNRPTKQNLFWGMKLENGFWIGQNKLGTLWMKVREQYNQVHMVDLETLGAIIEIRDIMTWSQGNEEVSFSA
jgi:predicted NAD-dependent protein-ADP-ribosyltransferase YbiA (DUF1768 family)